MIGEDVIRFDLPLTAAVGSLTGANSQIHRLVARPQNICTRLEADFPASDATRGHRR